jgi:indole-3-glycerol phosphate synthase / phosphoribosylanthranilate isomerase
MLPLQGALVNVRDDIVALRRERLAKDGPFQGLPRPEKREFPLVPFLGAEGVVCEMKRSSPSRGDIDPGFKAAERAALYAAGGAKNVSVLTEEDRFRGSLRDLMESKRAFPNLAILRKDFLFDETDVEVSFLMGADAVLLIASMLDGRALEAMASRASALGMSAMVEVHDLSDVEKCRAFKPGLIGINSRDLKTFRIDPLLPLRVRGFIDWPAKIVYESGILDEADAAFPGSSGFDGILVGEAVTRDPASVRGIREAFLGAKRRNFWNDVCAAMPRDALRARTLVKVCGIRDEECFRAAAEAGADLTGFMLAPSPRRVEPAFIESLGRRKDGPLRVGVVVEGPLSLDGRVVELVEEGFLDALQFHGDSAGGGAAFKAAYRKSAAGRANLPFYKAERPRTAEELAVFPKFGSPRILIDANSEKALGGTGEVAAEAVLDAAREALPGLWLAGGLNPLNVGKAVRERRPELVDASSGLESSPGVKDPDLVVKFVREVADASQGIQ